MKFFQRASKRDAAEIEPLRNAIAATTSKLDEAEKIAAPAERLIALAEAGRGLKKILEEVIGKSADRIRGWEMGVYFGGSVGGVLGGLALASLVNPVLGLVVGVAGLTVGMGSMMTGAVQKRGMAAMMKKIEPLEESYDALAARNQKAIAALIAEKSQEIVASEQFGKIYDRYPEVRDDLVKAFNQSAARQGIASLAPPPSPSAGKPGLSL